VAPDNPLDALSSPPGFTNWRSQDSYPPNGDNRIGRIATILNDESSGDLSSTRKVSLGTSGRDIQDDGARFRESGDTREEYDEEGSKVIGVLDVA